MRWTASMTDEAVPWAGRVLCTAFCSAQLYSGQNFSAVTSSQPSPDQPDLAPYTPQAPPRRTRRCVPSTSTVRTNTASRISDGFATLIGYRRRHPWAQSRAADERSR